jgi:hypothetical protein
LIGCTREGGFDAVDTLFDGLNLYPALCQRYANLAQRIEV